MLINISNHPSENWSGKQFEAAVNNYGEILDLPFPQIDPDLQKEDIIAFAGCYAAQITALLKNKKGTSAVHLMGEQTFCYCLVELLKEKNITVIASTTKRIAENRPDGSKVVKFSFCKFREY